MGVCFKGMYVDGRLFGKFEGDCLRLIPLIGNIKSGVEAIMRINQITGRIRGVSGISIIGGRVTKSLKYDGKVVSGIIKASDHAPSNRIVASAKSAEKPNNQCDIL